MHEPFWLPGIARLSDARTRSYTAENPEGRKGGGAQAVPPGPAGEPGSDPWCTPAASAMGRGWKVRPCARDIAPGQTLTLAEIEGPGVVQHVWCTLMQEMHRWLSLRVYYDGSASPSIAVPLGDFFANGLDGGALVNSLPVVVAPRGGMNSYWPMPFRKRVRIDVTNDGPRAIPEFFYQVTCALGAVPDDAGYLHACWRRATTSRERPEHVILDGVRGRGHYVGTYLVWNQFSAGWWGEGEVKFFIDGDAPDAPTICGTGTEDYFGGAWGFVMEPQRDDRPTTYSTPMLGYPQAILGPGEAPDGRPPRVGAHGLYRWHIADPVRFARDLRVTVQALGWWPTGKYQPLADDIASTAWWYQSLPTAAGSVPKLPPFEARESR